MHSGIFFKRTYITNDCLVIRLLIIDPYIIDYIFTSFTFMHVLISLIIAAVQRFVQTAPSVVN